ncbi:hypothetical protein TNCV_897771 [Trichonephila clavipes]|nr:hypothetical protein TNCV_897771 [Trichonephila clavipes]
MSYRHPITELQEAVYPSTRYHHEAYPSTLRPILSEKKLYTLNSSREKESSSWTWCFQEEGSRYLTG